MSGPPRKGPSSDPDTAHPKTTTASAESPSTAASRYQQLRSHPAELKLHAAAKALPAILDQATLENLSLTLALQRLLAVEVKASTARRLAGRLRFACLPTPASLADFDVDYSAAGASAGAAEGTINVRPAPGGPRGPRANRDRKKKKTRFRAKTMTPNETRRITT